MDPIRHVVTVACGPERAFEVFTADMGAWWDPLYSPDPASYTGIRVEPLVGGLVSLVHGDASYPFGEVTAWQPGERFTQTWTLAMDPSHPSSLDVRFEPAADGCRVVVEHGGWNAGNAGYRDKFRDWPRLLGRYAEAAGDDS